jgi:hypothetical protein
MEGLWLAGGVAGARSAEAAAEHGRAAGAAAARAEGRPS